MKMTTMKTWSDVNFASLVVVVALVAAGAMAPLGAAAGPLEPGVTFTKDIAPILQRSCENCHRPGGGAAMSLMTYADVRPWGTCHQRADHGPRDAAVVHRQEYWDPAVRR